MIKQFMERQEKEIRCIQSTTSATIRVIYKEFDLGWQLKFQGGCVIRPTRPQDWGVRVISSHFTNLPLTMGEGLEKI